MNDGRPLVPPRPNLGPEPWTEPETPVFPAVALLLTGCLALALIGTRFLRRGRASRTEAVVISSSAATPRERLIQLSNLIRTTLTNKFGPSLRAKTTRELATDPALAALFGDSEFRRFIEFLDLVDRLKFAPERPDPQLATLAADLAHCETQAISWQAKIRADSRAVNGTSGT